MSECSVQRNENLKEYVSGKDWVLELRSSGNNKHCHHSGEIDTIPNEMQQLGSALIYLTQLRPS